MSEFVRSFRIRRSRLTPILPWAIALFLASTLLFIADVGRADDNVLANGDLSAGTGDSPDHWKSEGWQTGPEFSTYTWNHPHGSPAEVEVINVKPNDARWSQTVHLGAGWYHFTASMRTEDVAENNTGANLSVLEDGIISDQIHGTGDWKTVGFYLKVGDSGADVALACRLGGYASLNTGKAFCRDLKGVKTSEPPASANPKYDLDVIRNAGAPPTTPTSTSNTTQATILLLAALVALAALLGSRGRGKKLMARLRLIVEPGPEPQPGTTAPSEQPRRQTEIVLFLVCLFSFAYFYQASDHSTASRFDLIRSILERHSLWIDGYAGYNTADIVELRARIYSNKAPGGAFTGLVPWAFISVIVGIFSSPPSALYWAFTTYLTTLFSVSLITAMLTVLMYRFALMLGAGNGRAVALALTLAFATMLLPYATEFTAEPIAAFCEFAAFYLLALPENAGAGLWRHLAAGLLAGWGVLCDYPSFLLAVGVAGYAAWRLRSWRKILTFGAGAIVVADLLMLYNKFAFNNPFFLSYEAYMLPGNTRFTAQSVGLAGVTYPKLNILRSILIDPQRGLFFCNPVVLLAIPGLFFFWQRRSLRPEFAVVAYAILSFTALNASYGDSIVYWGGGTAVGPRHFAPALPFVVLAMAFLPKRLDPVLGVLALASTFMMLMATAIEPHLPYEYMHPFREFLWPAYLRGDLAYNKSTYFGGPPIVGDSVAFNLGKFIGLPGALQLWPLAAAWIGGALYFLRNSGPPRPAPSARFVNAIAVAGIVAMFAPPAFGALFARSNLNQPQGLLGCYYEGMEPSGHPAHIKRVDSQINFDDIVQLGSLPPPSSVVWTGKITAPTTGRYQFMIVVDDSGWLKIDGRAVIADPGEVTQMQGSGGVELTSGPHSIEVGERNIWGGASMRLMWIPPGGFAQIVPSKYLVPDGSDCRRG